jgi:hypothetical protein
VVAFAKKSAVSNNDYNEIPYNLKEDYIEQNTSQQFEGKRIRLLRSIFSANNYIDGELSSMQKQNYSFLKQIVNTSSILKNFRERTRYFLLNYKSINLRIND